MNIKNIIDKLDELKPNQYSEQEKIDWLSDLDGRIMNDIIRPHQSDQEPFERYTDTKAELIAEDTYCDMYIYYLMAQIDFYNAEYTRYNNSSAAFNQAYSEYSRHYNRTHLPVSSQWKNL